MPLNVFDFYSRCLLPLTPDSAVCRILELITSGGETTDDFAKVVTLDTEVQHWIRLTVQRLGFNKRISRIDQMITLLGQDRVRDVIIGRHLERAFVKNEKTLIGELHAKAEKEEKKQNAGKAPPPKPVISDDPLAADEAIPALADFRRYLECANRAEEVAIAIRNSYPGQAFAGGVIFDYMRYHLRTVVDIVKVKDPRISKTDAFVNEIFIDGLRCGIAANEIIQKISIPHQKIIFMASMLHNVGKILLLVHDPEAFERAFNISTGSRDPHLKVESADAEMSEFDFDHAQAGALFLGRIPFLAEIERSVDHHHSPDILRFSNPGLYAVACVMRVSGALVKLYQNSRQKDVNVDSIPDQRLLKSRDFEFLKLSETDWAEIKANYALKLLKVEL